jgi:hypothetical protein
MPFARAVVLALSTVVLADLDEQPACRAACDQRWAAELESCQRLGGQGNPGAVSECQDGANNRHQDCIDDCND